MIKRLTLFSVCVMILSISLFSAQTLVENVAYTGLTAEECGVLSLSVPDQYVLIGRDVIASSNGGSTVVDTNFDCISSQSKTPLSITLLDNTKLTGDDATSYLRAFEQYFSFNAKDGLQNQMPQSGTSQIYICSVCDISAEFTVYYFDSEDNLNAALAVAQTSTSVPENTAGGNTATEAQTSHTVSVTEEANDSDVASVSVPLPILVMFGVILAILFAICAMLTFKYFGNTEQNKEASKSSIAQRMPATQRTTKLQTASMAQKMHGKSKAPMAPKALDTSDDAFSAYEEVFDE